MIRPHQKTIQELTIKTLPIGVLFTLFTTLLAGCGAGNFDKIIAPSVPVSVAGAAFHGNVHGGQQPVAGVAVQLYAVGSGGYGSAATSLLPAGSVVTDANGDFGFAQGSYSCPTAPSLVYLVGTGGQPIAATQTTPAVTNPNLALMVGLGPCSNLTDQTYINVNELTTVATIWALQQFMTGPANIGTSPSNATGLQNAFNAINNVVNTASGTLPGPTLPASAVLPINEINTLGNIIAQCVNSGGGSASSSGSDGSSCGALFYNAPNAAGTVYPTDTITAALNIALNPGRNVAALSNIPAPTAPFQPNLTAAPKAWTIAIGYSPAGLKLAGALAADQAGNIWVTDQTNLNLVVTNNAGAALSGTTGYATNQVATANDIAIDQNGYGWMIGKASGTLLRVDLSGDVTTVTGGGLTTPKALAIDGQGQVWATNGGYNTISGFSSSGTPLSSTAFGGAGANGFTIAIQSR